MEKIKKFKWIILAVLAIPVLFGLYVGGNILIAAITQYNPADIEICGIKSRNNEIFSAESEINIMIFNIGYCGLDKGQDFFMDGGKLSRSKNTDQTKKNLDEVISFLQKEDPDIILIQEIDKRSSRSNLINQYEIFLNELKDHNAVFATNYRVKWVPVPFLRPMGSVNSGLATFSRYAMGTAIRYQLPGSEKYFRQLFDLRRCILETVFELDNGKKLYLVNLHLSAYDKGGFVRKHQIAFLKDYMIKRYENGDHVILGGDWNHLLSERLLKEKAPEDIWPDWLQMLPDDFLPQGFVWAYDDNVMTVRDNDAPYRQGITFTTIIDGFLISDNIEVLEIEGYDLGFEHSDHNPVRIRIRGRFLRNVHK